MKKEKIELIVNGKRLDGRKPLELREVEMRVNVIPNADGSAYVRFGKTIAVAAVYGPTVLLPKHLQEEKLLVKARYNMLPFSVDERKSPGLDRRSIELSKVIRQALAPAIFLEEFPRAMLNVYVEILQADGSTRVTGINAASLALAMAGVPMFDLVAACSVGKVNNTIVLDVNGKEDNYSQADMAFAIMPSKKRVTLFQMDGQVTKQEISKMVKIATQACQQIYQMQKKAIKEVFK